MCCAMQYPLQTNTHTYKIPGRKYIHLGANPCSCTHHRRFSHLCVCVCICMLGVGVCVCLLVDIPVYCSNKLIRDYKNREREREREMHTHTHTREHQPLSLPYIHILHVCIYTSICLHIFVYIIFAG